MQIPSPSCSAGCRGSHSSVLFGRDLEVACVPPSEEGARRRRLLPGVGTTHRVGAKPPRVGAGAWAARRAPPVSVLAPPQLPGALDCSPSCSVCRSHPAEGSVVCAVHGGRGLVAAVLQNQFVIVT